MSPWNEQFHGNALFIWLTVNVIAVVFQLCVRSRGQSEAKDYNCFKCRRSDVSSWVPSIAVIPFFGPALYLFLRPPLASASIDGSEDITTGSGSS